MLAGERVTVGVDVGGTKLVASAVDAEGRAVRLERWPGRVREYEDVLGAIAELVRRIRASLESPSAPGPSPSAGTPTIVGVGVAAAAFLDAERHRVRGATYLVDWRDRPFADDLAERLELPVVVANDADAAAWGEYLHGAGRGARSLVLATVGTGIGGGIVIDGRLVTGGFGLGGEIGHLPVVPDGLRCGCGARGCVEQYASGTAIARAAQAAARAEPAAGARLLARAGGDADRIDGRLVTTLAHEGDALAARALGDGGEWLGRALAQVASIVDPSVVVVGGGLAEAAGELFLEPVRRAVADAASLPRIRPLAPVTAAELGNAAGIVGAASLAVALADEHDPKAVVHN
jgi:glucokinase